MLRKMTLSLFLGLGIAWPTMAQSPDIAPEDAIFSEAVRYYHDQLAFRSEPYIHNEAVKEVLNDLDGRVIVEKFCDGGLYRMVWDAGLEGIVISTEDEALPLVNFTDEYGRPAFESEYVCGWVDVAENELHVLVSIPGGGTSRWLGEVAPRGENKGNEDMEDSYDVVSEDGDGPLIATKQYVCTCGTTREYQNCNDTGMGTECTNQHPCTLSSGYQTKCMWRSDWKKEPEPVRWCGDASTGGAVLVAGMGLTTFCGPVRRTVMRRVRRGRQHCWRTACFPLSRVSLVDAPRGLKPAAPLHRGAALTFACAIDPSIQASVSSAAPASCPAGSGARGASSRSLSWPAFSISSAIDVAR